MQIQSNLDTSADGASERASVRMGCAREGGRVPTLTDPAPFDGGTREPGRGCDGAVPGAVPGPAAVGPATDVTSSKVRGRFASEYGQGLP